jgi:hypothetical protein
VHSFHYILCLRLETDFGVVTASEDGITVPALTETRGDVYRRLRKQQQEKHPDGVNPVTLFFSREPQFQDTMGVFMNLVPFRTDIARRVSFREVVASTRDTCVEALWRRGGKSCRS